MNKRMKRSISMIFMAMFLVVSSLSVTQAATKKTVAVKSITLNKKMYTLKKKGSVVLKATVLPKNATNKTVIFKSSNSKVATVSSKGKVVAKKEGTAKITATVKGTNKKATCTIKVGTPVSKVTFKEKKVKLFEGESKVVTAVVSPKKPTVGGVTYSSTNKKVADVNSKGKITAKKAGTATIIATSKDGTGKNARLKVTVSRRGAWSVTTAKITKIAVDESVNMGVKVSPANTKIKSITYKSSDSVIAQVDSKGNIKGMANGTVAITACVTDTQGKSKTVELKDIEVYTPVREVCVSEQEKTISMDETVDNSELYQIVANILPETASNKNLVYTSDHTEVATVSETGLVTAHSEGRANITISSVDGNKSATVVITVNKVTNHKVVTTSEQFTNALQDDTIELIKIKNMEGLTIPEGDYSDVSLVIDAPKGHIENYGRFKDVTINAISDTTYAEFSHNKISYFAITGSIKVCEGGMATIAVLPGAENVNIINNGAIAEIVLNTKVNVLLKGASDDRINLTATAEAEEAFIRTEKNLEITANAKLNLLLKRGAENTRANVGNRDMMPNVVGLGSVEVSIAGTSDVEVIVGENIADSDEAETQKVNVNGNVTDVNGECLGAKIYVIPYQRGITEENVGEFVNSNTRLVTTDEDGNYCISDLTIGNYYLYIEKEGYQSASHTLELRSNSDKEYYVPAIYLVSKEATYGNITGTLKDAQTGSTVPAGISLRIRAGMNNLSGEPLAATVTSEAGEYTFTNLKCGSYTIQVVDNRENEQEQYVNDNFNVVVEEGDRRIPDRAITKAIGKGQIRVVLKWGDEASGASADLDSHMTGPAADGKDQFHTWYSNRVYADSETRYTDLDVDDTTWEGPETTTIYQNTPGVYHFYVHDYTNQSSPASTQMGRSQAVVEVYRGDDKIDSFSVPNQAGNLWQVCDIEITDKQNIHIIPVNQMMGWTDALADIGIDMVDKYQNLLKDCINEVEQQKDTITDEEWQSEAAKALEKAKQVLLASEDYHTLKDAYQALRDCWEKVASEAAISTISGEDIDYISDVSTTVEGYSVYTVYGFTETMPQLAIEFDDKEATYEMMESDIERYSAKVHVKTKRGYQITYYLQYKISSNTFAISSVSSNETDAVKSWSIDSYDDDDDETIYSLTVYGYSGKIPSDLSIQPRYQKANVSELSDSNRSNYEKMFTISVGDASRTYYVKSALSQEAFAISSITCGDPDTLTDWTSDYNWDENDEKYYYITLEGYNADIPQDLVITPNYEKAVVSELKDSDRTGFEKMFTVSVGDVSRTYYVKKTLSQKVFAISSITCGDSDTLTDWYSDYEWDENDEKYYYITLEGYNMDIPQDLVITPNYEKAVVSELKDSDRTGFEKMFTISVGDVSRTYYVKKYIDPWGVRIDDITVGESEDWIRWNSIYEYEPETNQTIAYITLYGYEEGIPDNLNITARYHAAVVSGLDDSDRVDYAKMFTISVGEVGIKYYIRKQVPPEAVEIQTIESSDKEALSDWECESRWDENDEQYDVVILYGNTPELPSDLTIIPNYEKAIVSEFADSNRVGYEKMFTISVGEVSRTYYVEREYPMSWFEIGDIVCEDTEAITNWNMREDFDSNQKKYYYVNLYGYHMDIPEDIKIIPKFENAVVSEIIDSDRMDYDKMFTISVGDVSRTYYVKKQISSDAVGIRAISSEEVDAVCDWKCDYDWDDDRFDYVILYGYTEGIPGDLVITPNYSQAVVSEIVDSDRSDFEKMFTISSGEISRTYYIRKEISPDVTGLANITSESGLLREWEMEQSWDDEYYVDLYLYSQKIPDDLVITPKYSQAVVSEIIDSDGSDYQKMFTISVGDICQTYYVNQYYDSSGFDIADITSETGLLRSWKSYDTWYDDEKIDYVDMKLYTEELPDDLVITPRHSKAVVSEIMDSDRESYQKMFTVSIGEVSKTYYVSYTSVRFDIENITSADVASAISWYSGYEYVYDENNNENIYYYVVLYGQPGLAESISVIPKYSKAVVSEIMDSDREGYETMFTISVGEEARTYYVHVYEQN